MGLEAKDLLVGGLGKMTPPPSATQAPPAMMGGGAPNPLAMAAQGNAATQSQDTMESIVKPGLDGAAQRGDQQLISMLQKQLAAGFASTQELSRAQEQRRNAYLSQLDSMPEMSGFDLLARGVSRGMAGHPELLQRGNLSSLLASTAVGTESARAEYEKDKLNRSKMAYDVVDKDFDGERKQLFDTTTKLQAAEAKRANVNKLTVGLNADIGAELKTATDAWKGDKTSAEFLKFQNETYDAILRRKLPVHLGNVDPATADAVLANIMSLRSKMGSDQLIPVGGGQRVPAAGSGAATPLPPTAPPALNLAQGAPGARSDIADFPGAFSPSDKATAGTVLGSNRPEIMGQEILREREAKRAATSPREVENALNNLKSLSDSAALLPKAEREQLERWLTQAEVAANKGTPSGDALVAKRVSQIQAILPTAGTAPTDPSPNQINAQKVEAEERAKARVAISTGAQQSGARESGTETVKSISEGYKNLSPTVAMTGSLNNAMTEWYTARPQFGTGAELMNKTRSFLSNRLGIPIDPDTISSPQAFQAAMTPIAAKLTRQTDSQPAQAQVEQIRMAIGNLENDPNAVPKIIQALYKLTETDVSMHNKLHDDAVSKGIYSGADKRINLPPLVTKIAKNSKGETWALMSDGSEKRLSGGK